ncbi:MAG: head decoration protein [Alphaproteobacteria bacterium]|nr:head decoration protein [Alphaproteobacteria bacterium]
MSIEEKDRPFSILKYEADKNYSREVVKIAKGQNLKMGTVVGMIAKDETYKIVALTKEKTVDDNTTTIVQADDSALDGSEIAVGIVLQDVDATDAATEGLIVARDAIVIEDKVIYPNDAMADQKKKILKDLENRGIVVRKGA